MIEIIENTDTEVCGVITYANAQIKIIGYKNSGMLSIQQKGNINNIGIHLNDITKILDNMKGIKDEESK